MISSARFTQGECLLQDGDAIVIYSDGVTEARNNQEEMYEEERLSELLQNVSGLEASTIMDRILKSVDGFASGVEQADDISVIVIKRD
jgi:sigma-B regulation protein RsbU (phosphoserine phosphatase)